jgi:hypothetical protein
MTAAELAAHVDAALAQRHHLPPGAADRLRRDAQRLLLEEGEAAALRHVRLIGATIGLPRRFVSDRSRRIPHSPLVRD